jgi:hypothetical protein
MLSSRILRSQFRVAVLVGAACLASVAAPAQTPTRPPARPAQPAPKKPAGQPAKPAAPKPAEVTPAPAPPPDVTVKMRYVTGDKTTTSTVSMKGTEQRIDYGSELVVLQECDLGRVVQVSDANKKYLVAAPGGAPSAAAGQSPAAKTDGVVTYTATVTDTGERKQMFNVTARHLSTVLTKEATPKACDKKKEHVETDGWYIDAPAGALCAVSMRNLVPAPTSSDCRDEVRYVGPDISKIGYPIAYTITTTTDSGKPSTMAMEVTDLTRSVLPATLFSIPDGYAEVKKLEDLAKPLLDNSEKKAGTVRIGVAPIGNKANGDASLDVLHDALVVSLGDAELDAVALAGDNAAELTADARSKNADFILTTDIAEVKQAGGGVLGKLSGTSKDSFSAKVDFKLVAVGGTASRLSSSEKSGTSTLKMAIGAAKNVSRFVTPLGLMGSRFNFMSAFSQLSNGASPTTMQQSPDPVLNTVFFLVDRATGGPAETDLKSEDAAVASAMEREVKAVASEILKKR